jgi:hypothetical protein
VEGDRVPLLRLGGVTFYYWRWAFIAITLCHLSGVRFVSFVAGAGAWAVGLYCALRPGGCGRKDGSQRVELIVGPCVGCGCADAQGRAEGGAPHSPCGLARPSAAPPFRSAAPGTGRGRASGGRRRATVTLNTALAVRCIKGGSRGTWTAAPGRHRYNDLIRTSIMMKGVLDMENF